MLVFVEVNRDEKNGDKPCFRFGHDLWPLLDCVGDMSLLNHFNGCFVWAAEIVNALDWGTYLDDKRAFG